MESIGGHSSSIKGRPVRRRGVRSIFVCPGCKYQLHAVLSEENTTVRCECETEFVVQLPPSKGKGKPKSQLTLRSMSRRSKVSSDSDSYSSIPSLAGSLSSVVSMQVSACSTASLVNAPSVVSMDSFAQSESFSVVASDGFGEGFAPTAEETIGEGRESSERSPSRNQEERSRDYGRRVGASRSGEVTLGAEGDLVDTTTSCVRGLVEAARSASKPSVSTRRSAAAKQEAEEASDFSTFVLDTARNALGFGRSATRASG